MSCQSLYVEPNYWDRGYAQGEWTDVSEGSYSGKWVDIIESSDTWVDMDSNVKKWADYTGCD